ncbi:hypothetical protein BDR22DRAFT_814679 [Usnea florida]
MAAPNSNAIINATDPRIQEPKSSRPTYSPTQLSQYFARIDLPPHLHPTPTITTKETSTETTLALLTTLQKHHLATIPFENLNLHYSTHHTISLDPSSLFEKIVTRRRGGYCMETNTFFAVVLRSLGFRVRGVRVVWGGLEECEDEGQRIWLYQYREGEGREWESVYCFTEVEFLPQDYEVMSFWTSQCPKSWFTQRVVVVKMLVEGEEVVGTVSLSGAEVKRKGGAGTEVLRLCEGEGERVRALEEVFGVRLTEEERRGIRGMVSELKV